MGRTIEISDETFEKLKDQLTNEGFKDITKLEDLVGEKLFIRTVTYHLIGRVKRIIGSMVELESASWIADSGRFMQAIADGVLSEVEPIRTKWFVNLYSVCDMGIWKHKLPTEQK